MNKVENSSNELDDLTCKMLNIILNMPPGFFFAAFNKMHEDGDNRKEGLVRKRSHDFIVFKTLCLSLQQDATVNK